ncbi:hypothetical protein HBI13_026230 [Parastagonospora nodorum]|nr:hypothetical protein HBI10_042780 [Parastagonospora nodorum]KAH4030899.1 hypothetical protein HBI13_026230 [Parastagonospora nodorum]KAH5449099.1 hypothetical protein HBI30_155720 [Parastagonospora nodorum]KAH6009171.1 hypothetical protein HBI84_047080 [Parastagonospora nodorum]KAH6223326.1 hypothetical protein HBI53_066000 [Parastagonospora nodorum]
MGNNQSTPHHHNRLAKPKTNTNSPAPTLLTDSPVSVNSRYADLSAKGRYNIKETLLSPIETEDGSAPSSKREEDAIGELAPRSRGRPLSMLSRSNSKANSRANSRTNSRSNSLSCFGGKHGSTARLNDLSEPNGAPNTQLDLEAAIRLLQEVKKNASPDDLAALQEIWEGSTDTVMPSEPTLSRRTSAANGSSSSLTRRRSLVQTPGVATRNSPGEGRRRTWNSWKPPQVAPEEEAKWAATPKGTTKHRLAVPETVEASPNGSAVRAQTPSDLDYGHLGSLQLGTLSIVNGQPSPAVSMKVTKQSAGGELDYFTAQSGYSPLTMKSARQRGHMKSKSLSVPAVPPLYNNRAHEMVVRPRTRDSDRIPQGPRPQKSNKALRVTNNSERPVSQGASEYAQDYQSEIPHSPFEASTVFASTVFDAPITAIEASGSSLFSAVPRVSVSEEQTMQPRQRPAPRTSDSGYSSGGSLRTHNGRYSADSGRSSKNSVQEEQASRASLPRESDSSAHYDYQLLANVDEADGGCVPAHMNVSSQSERASTSRGLPSPNALVSRFSLNTIDGSTSPKFQNRLQRRRPSQTELPTVQSCQSIPEATIPGIPDNVRAKFTRRLSNTPGIECLEHTYPTKEHILTAGSEVSTVAPLPSEAFAQLAEIEPGQTPRPVHKRHRSLSLFRRKSTVENKDANKNNVNASVGVVDLGTIASSLGNSPYDAAMSVPLRKTVTSPTHPHQLGGAQPRPRSRMDSGEAAEFARIRSKDRALAEQEMPQQQRQQRRRKSFHTLKEADEANVSRRRYQSVHDIPPVPTIDIAKHGGSNPAQLEMEMDTERKTNGTFIPRSQAKGEVVSELVEKYDKHAQNPPMQVQILDWDAHTEHWNHRRKSIGEGLRTEASFGEASASTVNSRNKLPDREELAAWGRFSGGLAYNYEGRGGTGVGGSAGTRSLHSKASSKSMQWKHQYGVDLSDVPIMLQRV